MKQKFTFLFLIILTLSLLVPGCYNGEFYDAASAPGASQSNPMYVSGPLTNEINENDLTDMDGIITGNGTNFNAIIKPSGDIVGTTETQTLSNKTFNAGSSYLNVYSTDAAVIEAQSNRNDNVAAIIQGYKYSTSPADEDYLFSFVSYGKNSASTKLAFGSFGFIAKDVTSTEEDTEFYVTLRNDGDYNKAFYVSGNGTAYFDTGYEIFDSLDDALVIRQGVSERDFELLESIGIYEKRYKLNKDGQLYLDAGGNPVQNGYYINMQNMINLLAGGIYQNRDYIESLEARIKELEDLPK